MLSIRVLSLLVSFFHAARVRVAAAM
jgi:hypothetical protein